MNQFGPAKLFSVSFSATLIGMSLALEPGMFAAMGRQMLRSRLAWGLAAYLGVALLSMVTAVDRLHSAFGSYPEYQGLLMLVLWAVIGLGAASLVQREDGWQRIARAVVVALIAVAAVAWLQKAGVTTVGGLGGLSKRVWATLGNASNLGVWLVLALPFSVERLLQDDRRAWRVTAVVSGLLGVVALAWTTSRGAWIGFVFALIVGIVLITRGRPRGERVRVALAGAGALVLAAGVVLVTPGRFARLSWAIDPAKGSARWRFIIWQTAVRIVRDRPVLGWGLNSMRFVYPSYRSASAWDSPIEIGTVADTHNVILNTATSLGIAGAVALLICVVTAAVAVWRAGKLSERESRCAATVGVSLVGFFVAALFHYPTMDSGTLAAVVIGLLVSVDARLWAERAGEPIPAQIPGVSVVRPAWRFGAYTLLAALVVGLFASASLVVADGAAARALAMTRARVPWVRVRPMLSEAQALAPWELVYRKVWASAGTAAIARGDSSGVAADVERALDAADRLAPLDASIAAARGDLMLQVALGSGSALDLAASERAYRDAAARDPNNAVYYTGIASVQDARGDLDGAVTSLEQAVALARRSPQMWRTLARAYRVAGRSEDASTAEQSALTARDQ